MYICETWAMFECCLCTTQL